LSVSSVHRVDRRLSLTIAVLALCALAVAIVSASPAAASKTTPKTKVMTRNLYLGADLSPGINAQNFNELKDAAGQILHQVDQNKFQVRAKGLATEILSKRPDLVGLQEVALWRTGPCKVIVPPNPFEAKHVRYDFLKLLLHQLNAHGKHYRAVVVQPEFDFETEANTDGSADHSCDTNARLTMRDVILARRHAGVKATNAHGGHYDTLLQVKVSGVPIDVTRGWTAVDAKVREGPRFRLVNTHLEAFDNQLSNQTNQGTQVGNGKVRKAQAQELIAPGGPAAPDPEFTKPVVLVGDLNSDVRTQLKPGDGAADWWLLSHGFRERSTHKPLSCCLNADVLRAGGDGDVSQFDHKVDHIMTNDPRHVRRGRTAVTGRAPHNGFWDSDHAGLFSVLRFPRTLPTAPSAGGVTK
jgi:endonuclease/exonuclease/phosphatase family metal-dependent hydrolase